MWHTTAPRLSPVTSDLLTHSFWRVRSFIMTQQKVSSVWEIIIRDAVWLNRRIMGKTSSWFNCKETNRNLIRDSVMWWEMSVLREELVASSGEITDCNQQNIPLLILPSCVSLNTLIFFTLTYLDSGAAVTMTQQEVGHLCVFYLLLDWLDTMLWCVLLSEDQSVNIWVNSAISSMSSRTLLLCWRRDEQTRWLRAVNQ